MPPARETFQEEAEAAVDRVLDHVGRRSCRSPIVCEAPAGPTLVAHGADAGLIVVGTRGRGAVADTLLGSVSTHVATHATVPVVIVPPTSPITDRHRRVVVGVDGSPNSIGALSWAIRTTPDDVALEAVFAWSHSGSALPSGQRSEPDLQELQARQTLDRTVVESILAAGGTRHEITHRLQYGDPRVALHELAQDADLLVLGTRGQHGLAGLLLGSTTTALVHRPPTAIVVVPFVDDHESSSPAR